MEVACGEYGTEYLNRMVELIDNGRVVDWKPSRAIQDKYETNNYHDRKLSCENPQLPQFEEEINPNNLKFKCSSWQQFCVLFRRASKQIYNNKVCQV